MEYRKQEIRAGVFLLLAFVLFAVMVFAVSDVGSLLRKRKVLRVLFTSSEGIEQNAQVRYAGIKVGKVTNIRVAPELGDRVELTLNVLADTLIREDTKASIKTLGLIGAKYVELSGGSAGAKPLGPDAVLTGEEPFKLEDLTQKGMEVAEKLRSIASNLDRTLGSPALSRDVKTAVANVRTITENLKVMTANKDQVAESLKNLPDLLKKLDASVANLQEVTAKADALVGGNRKNVDATMENVKEITKNLKDLTADVKKHPWKLIRKP